MKIREFGKIIQYIDNWKKFTLVTFLLIIGVIMYLILDNKQLISEWIQSQNKRITIDINTAGDIANDLLTDIHGQTLIVWDVDIKKNVMRAVYVNKNRTRIPSLEGSGDVIFRQNDTTRHSIIELINNESFCYDINDSSYIERKAFNSDIRYICSSAIPPNFGEIAGVVSVGFNENENRADYIKLKIKDFSTKIASRDAW